MQRCWKCGEEECQQQSIMHEKCNIMQWSACMSCIFCATQNCATWTAAQVYIYVGRLICISHIKQFDRVVRLWRSSAEFIHSSITKRKSCFFYSRIKCYRKVTKLKLNVATTHTNSVPQVQVRVHCTRVLLFKNWWKIYLGIVWVLRNWRRVI